MERITETKPDLSNSLILRGNDVCLLPTSLLRLYCDEVAIKLARNPNTVDYSSDDLLSSVLDSRAVVGMDLVTNRLLGFAQIKHKEGKVWEVGSWTSFVLGMGKPVFLNASVLIYETDPQAQAIAKIRERNTHAHNAITEMGWKLINHETSEQHFDPNSLQPIQKLIYDVSFEKLIPKASPKKEMSSDFTEIKSMSIWQYMALKGVVRRLRQWFENKI